MSDKKFSLPSYAPGDSLFNQPLTGLTQEESDMVRKAQTQAANQAFLNSLEGIPTDYQNIYVPGRLDELAEASKRQKEHLARVSAIEARDAQSLVGQLGLDPRGLPGTVVNQAASFAAGGAEALYHGLVAPSNARILNEERRATAEDHAAFNAMQQGKATPEQQARLNETLGERYQRELSQRQQQEEDRLAALSPEARETALARRAITSRIGQAARKNLPEAYRPVSFVGEDKTIGDALADADTLKKARDKAKEVLVDGPSSLVHEGRQREFRRALQNDPVFQEHVAIYNNPDASVADKAKAVAGMMTSQAALDHPVAIMEFLARELPEMALTAASGGLAGVVLNANRGMEMYQEGVQNYEQKHGEPPPQEVRDRMAKQAILHAGMDTVVDSLLVGKWGKAGSALKEAGKEAAETVTKAGSKALSEASLAGAYQAGKSALGQANKTIAEAAQEGFKAGVKATSDVALDTAKVGGKAALEASKGILATGASVGYSLAKGAAKAAAPFATGYVTEGATEAFQTYLEGEITHKPATGQEVGEAAVIGGAVGATVKGGLETTQKVGNYLAGSEERAAQKQAKRLARDLAASAASAEFEKKVIEGDEKTLRTQPVDAMNVYQKRMMDDSLPMSERQDAFSKAESLKKTLEERVNTRKDNFDWLSSEDAKSKLSPDEIATELEAAGKDYENSQNQLEQINQIYQTMQVDSLREVDIPESSPSPASNTSSVSSTPVDFSKVSLAKAVKDLDSDDTVTRQSASDQLVLFAQAMPVGITGSSKPNSSPANIKPSEVDSSSPEIKEFVAAIDKALALNDLTPAQRNVLTSFKESQEALDEALSMPRTAKGIFSGTEGFIGLSQYRQHITNALQQGDDAKAQAYLKNLNAFARRHANKHEAVQSAYAEVANGKGRVNLLPGKGAWSDRVLGSISNQELKERGGVYVTASSKPLVDATGAEAKAIAAMAKEMNALYDYHKEKQQTRSQQRREEGYGVEGVKGVDKESNEHSTPENTTSENKTEKKTKKETENLEQEGKKTTVEPTFTTTKRVPKAPKEEVNTANLTRAREEDQPQTHQIEQQEVGKTEARGVAGQEQKDASKASEDVGKVEQDVADPVLEDGKLSVLQPKEGDSVVQQRFKSQLQQSQGRGEDSRPLVAAKDFFSRFLKNKNRDRLQQFIPHLELNSDHEVTLRNLSYWLEKMLPDIQASVPQVESKALKPRFNKVLKKLVTQNTTKQEEFWYQNLMNHFLVSEGKTNKIDENLATAIAVAGYSWIAENGKRVILNDDKAINAILHVASDKKVSREARNSLQEVGTRQAQVADAIGIKVVQMLGIKDTPQTPKNILPQLRMVFGMHALHALDRQGLIEINQISSEALNKFNPAIKPVKHQFHTFIQIKKHPNASQKTEWGKLKAEGKETSVLSPYAPIDAVRNIADANSNSGSVVSKLFGFKPDAKMPSLKPKKAVAEKGKKSFFGIPKKLKEAMQVVQTTENFIRKDTATLLDAMGEERWLHMSGARDLKLGEDYIDAVEGQEAKNQGLGRELEHIVSFMRDALAPALKEGESLYNKPFFFTPAFWVQQRMGLEEAVNPQTSKMHRHMVTRKQWISEVKTNDPESKKFLLARIADSFGTKTDRNSIEKVAKETEALLEGELKPAVDALLKHAKYLADGNKEGFELTEAEKDAIQEAVAKGGENLFSLDGLMAYAQYKLALEEGRDTFTTYLVGEVDGVTNGPMLANFLAGILNNNSNSPLFMQRGGFFLSQDKSQSFHEYMLQGGRDFYETNLDLLRETLDRGNQWVNTFDRVFNLSKNRNLMKAMVTPIWYGASLPRTIEAMGENAWEQLIKQLEKAVKAELDGESGAVAELGKDIFALTGGKVKINSLKAGQYALTHGFPDNIKDSFVKSFNQNIGKDFAEKLENVYAKYFNQRSLITSVSQIQYAIFKALYESRKKELIKELVEKGEIPSRTDKNGNKVPTADLNAEQEAALLEEIKGVLPAIATYASSQDADPYATGLMAASLEKIFTGDSLYQSEIQFAQPFSSQKAHITAQGKVVGKDFHSVSLEGSQVVWDDPGVFVVPGQIHSLDSGISHEALLVNSKNAILNIHDAHVVGINGMMETSQALNQATFNALTSYNPAKAMSEGLARSLQSISSKIQERSLPSGFIEELKRVLQISDPASKETKELLNKLEDAALQLHLLANDNQQAVANLIEDASRIDQYAFDGGAYEITQENRNDALTRLNEKLAAPEKTLDALNSVFGLIENKKNQATKTDVRANPKANSFESFIQGITQEVNSVFLPANKLIEGMKTALNQANKAHHKMYGVLLNELLGNIDSSGLKIRYVNKPEKFNELKETLQAKGVAMPENVPALYLSESHTIVLLSQDLTGVPLTTEYAVHELIHAYVYNLVQNELAKKEAGKKYDSKVIKAWENLNDLYEYVKENHSNEVKPHWIENAHEFLAYSLTNAEFIEFLKNTEIPKNHPLRKKGALGELLQRVMNAIAEIFFGDKLTTARNSLLYRAVLDGSRLFKSVETKQGKLDKTFKASKKKDAQISLFVQGDKKVSNTQTVQGLNPFPDEEGIKTESSNRYDLLNDLLTSLAKAFSPEWIGAVTNFNVFEQWSVVTGLGVTPEANSVRNSPLKHEDSQINDGIDMVYSITKASLTVDNRAYDQLVRAYNKAKEAVKPNALGEAAYNYLFGLENGKLAEDYLERFASLASVHPEVKELLKGVDVQPETLKQKHHDLGARIGRTVKGSVQSLVQRAGKNPRPKADALVPELIMKLALQHGKRAREKLNDRKIDRYKDKVDEGIKDAVSKFGDLVQKGSKLPIIRDRVPAIIEVAGMTISAAAQGKLNEMTDLAMSMRNQVFQEKLGLGAAIFQDIRGHKEWAKKLIRASSLVQGRRQQHKDVNVSVLKEAFMPTAKEQEAIKQNGKRANEDVYTAKAKGMRNAYLSDKHSAALTASLLRTDAAALLGTYSLEEIQSFLSNPQALEQAIQHQIKGLDAVEGVDPKLIGFYGSQANGLGFYMAKGYAVLPNQLRNASNIAHAWGTQQQTKEASKEVIKAIDTLASLYGLKYADASQKALAARVMEAEAERTALYDDVVNGVELMLLRAHQLKEESQSTLFRGKPGMMIKGYMPEITNPYTQVVVGTEAEASDLILQGYEKVADKPLDQDPADPSEKKYLWIRRESPNAQTATGAMLLKSLKMKGSSLHDGFVNDFTQEGLDNRHLNQRMQKKHHRLMKEQFLGMAQVNLEALAAQPGQVKMVPVFNEEGRLANYVYTMRHEVRDALLERTNAMEEVLGTLAGHMVDKPDSEKQNRLVIDALKQNYDQTTTFQRHNLIWVGENAKDSDLVDRWRKLPQTARNYAEDVFGSKGMWIPIESLDLITGYKKWNLADHFIRNPQEQKAWQELLHSIYPALFSGKVLARMNKTQRFWEELVTEAKNNIVIKTGFVLAGNVASNTLLLKMWGVGPSKMITHQYQAMKLAKSYFADVREKLELEIGLGGLQGTALQKAQSRISQLQQRMDKNPIQVLVDEGMMPTIVDDVEQEHDLYTFKTGISKKLSKISERIPDPVKEVGKFLYMGRDTAMYRFMADATKLSDLAARFVLYEHLTTKKSSSMTHEKAIEIAGDAFVNYDIPLPRPLQAMDDLGLMLFTKYFFRIQKVIVDTFAHNPSGVASLVLLDHLIGMPEMITDSGLLVKLGNPLESGFLEYFSSLDNPMPIHFIEGIFK